MKAGSKDVAKMFFSTFLRVGHSLPQNSQPSSKFTTFLKIQNLPQNSKPSSKFTTFLKIHNLPQNRGNFGFRDIHTLCVLCAV